MSTASDPADNIALSNFPPDASHPRPPQAQREAEPEEEAQEIVLEKCSKDEKGCSPVLRSPSIPTATGPANGFWWDPVVDSLGAGFGRDASSSSRDASAGFRIVRPFLLGSLVGCLGATIYQLFVFKPVYATVSSPFLVLVVYIAGLAWEWVVPSAPLTGSGFGLQEHAVASMIAIAASRGNLAVQTFAVQRLYYEHSRVDWPSAALGIFASIGLGCGIAGLFESFATLSPEIVFPLDFPVITLLKDLHSKTCRAESPSLGLFCYSFGASFLYEVIPAYISPVLTGVSVFCLATRKAVRDVRVTVTNVFGGASGNEGLGLLSLCLDWQFIGTSHATMPLMYQANTWVGYILCYGAVMGLYYSSVTSNTLMIATAIFGADGEVYDQRLILTDGFDIDRGILEVVGLPKLATSALWTSITANIALGSLAVYGAASLGLQEFWPFRTLKDDQPPEVGPGGDSAPKPLKTDSIPGWWHTILIFLSLFAGLTMVFRQHLHGTRTGFLIAVVLGVLAVPTSTSLYGCLGVDMVFRHATKMVGGLLLPGRPLAILYFSMWSNSVISNSVFTTSQIKFGQSLGVAPRVTFLCILWGSILGGLVSYAVSESVIHHQAATLVAPTGLYMWSGQLMQTMNSESMTWALARDLYSTRGPYYIVPFGFLIGLCLSLAQWGLGTAFPKATIFDRKVVMIPVIFMASSMMTYGNTSAILSTVIVGIISQIWCVRKKGRGALEASVTTLGAALDGGSQSMVLLLSLSVFGAMGSYIPFMKWAGNNVGGNVDYCDPT